VKTLGIIGGLGPESTIEYYKELFRAYRERVPDGSQPQFLINSVNMKVLVDAVTISDYATMANYLAEQIAHLAQGGADFAIVSANTPHLVFDEVERRSSIPLISIVEAAAEATQMKELKRVGLMGTRFTMQARLFPEVFERHGIEIVTPNTEEQAAVHDIYMNELLKGIIRDQSRERLLQIADRMQYDDQIEGLLLGGTELSLIIKSLDGTGLELLDTMKIQIAAAVKEMLS
jgi:aspartate racemase